MSFQPGEEVLVRDDWPEQRGEVHIRTPHYVRGHRGTIVRHLGDYPNPEQLAFARPADDKALYHVAFRLNELWPDEGSPKDVLLVEIYEHWLERP